MEKTTTYGVFTGFYFRKILHTIIEIKDLKNSSKTILDFGCGTGELKKLLKKYSVEVINYDTKKEITDIKDWKKINFDILIASQVFYTFNKRELYNLLKSLKIHNPNLELIVAISNQNIFNKLLAIIAFEFDAHKNTRLVKKEEKEIIEKFAKKISSKNSYCLTEVIHYRLK